jgi:hypothetical protein
VDDEAAVKITCPRLILFILGEILILLIALAALKAQVHPPEGPQVAMVVDSDHDGKKRVIPQGIVRLTLMPFAGPTAKAPLKPGDIMLCHLFDMKDQVGGLHVAVRCGVDTYLVEALWILPGKEK